MMSRLMLIFVMMLLATSAYAGSFTDEMAKCLVTSTSEADKTLLVKWIYAAISAHPDVKAMSNVSKQRGDQLNKDTAARITTLLTQRCKTETGQALKYEGETPVKASFEVLGKVAMMGLMSNPEVEKYFSGFQNNLDEKALQKAFEPLKPAENKSKNK